MSSSEIINTLIQAAGDGNEETVLSLLNRNEVNVNDKGSDGYTALIMAAKNNRESIVSLLIDRGADINSKDFHGSTALKCAAIHNLERMVSLLIDRGADVNGKDNIGYSALINAVVNNLERMVSLLIDRGADVNSKDKGGDTALMYAAIHNLERIAALLIDRGADVNGKNNRGYSALKWAATNNLERMVSLLIDRGADVNSKDKGGDTALMYAAIHNLESIVLLLIDRGADVNSESNDGSTALMMAAMNNRESIVLLLIDRGADVNSKNNDNWTALDWAENYPNIISIIQNKQKIEAPYILPPQAAAVLQVVENLSMKRDVSITPRVSTLPLEQPKGSLLIYPSDRNVYVDVVIRPLTEGDDIYCGSFRTNQYLMLDDPEIFPSKCDIDCTVYLVPGEPTVSDEDLESGVYSRHNKGGWIDEALILRREIIHKDGDTITPPLIDSGAVSLDLGAPIGVKHVKPRRPIIPAPNAIPKGAVSCCCIS